MRKVVLSVCGVAALLAVSRAALADTVIYDTTGGSTKAIDQQTGNADYYIGDTVTPGPNAGTLTTIQVVFGSSSLGSSFTYTPNISLDLYDNALDASLHNGTGFLGSAVVNNVPFTNDGNVNPYVGYNYEDEQLLTFDFTSQNISLPASFAFAYHDTPTVGSSVDGANGLSVGLNLGDGYFYTYPNDGANPDGLFAQPGFNVEAIVSVASPVPLPSSAWGGLTLLAGLGLVTGVKRMRRQLV